MLRTVTGAQGGRIIIDGKEVINMAANNYLGLANHPEVVMAAKEAADIYGVGPAAGRTIAGNFDIHNRLEKKLAGFKDSEDSLVFHSGLSANLGVIPVLVDKKDTIYSDELNHASIIDGCRLSRATIKPYPHLNMPCLESLLKESTAGKKLIVTDCVFSMDGDVAPLDKIAALSKKYNAMLMIDDAHGDGVMGSFGKGTADYFGLREEITVETGSLSKAFGTCGGYVAGSKQMISDIRKKARSFIFTSSALPPIIAAATCKSLDLLSQSDELVQHLWNNRKFFVDLLQEMHIDIGSSKSPIIPVILGDEDKAIKMSQSLYDLGIYAQALAFPIVPKGKARLRIIISAAHTQEDLRYVAENIEKTGRQLRLL